MAGKKTSQMNLKTIPRWKIQEYIKQQQEKANNFFDNKKKIPFDARPLMILMMIISFKYIDD